jgi:TPR repeat protein
VVFIDEIAAFPADSCGPALALCLGVVSLTSITLLIAPFARHAQAQALAQGSKAEGMRAWRRGDCEAAMQVLWPFAESGEADAQNAIGEMLISGKTEVPRSDSEATAWFRKAAFQGYARAQVNLGFVLEQTGRIAAKKEAARWYRCAALQGFAAGQHHLARHYETGEGLPRDMSQAVFWYTKAINQNYALSQVAFGLMRYAGIGVTRNPADALRLFRLASDQGLAEAQYYLGMMYAGIASTRQSIESR